MDLKLAERIEYIGACPIDPYAGIDNAIRKCPPD
jgi:hypothetical protein